MSPLRAALGMVAGAALLTALLVAAHRTASDPTEGSVFRISLRTTAGTAEDCRKLSAGELEALPRHMRRPEVCETRAVPYRLLVRIDGQPRLEAIYTASGIHGDRPLVVDEEFAVATGRRTVHVDFRPEDPAPGAGKDQKDQKGQKGQETGSPADAAPPEAPVFEFDAEVEFPEGRIRVATLDDAGTSIEVR